MFSYSCYYTDDTFNITKCLDLEVNLSSADLTNVRYMDHAFERAAFKSINLNGQNFENLITAKNVFSYTNSLESIDLRNLTLPKLENLYQAFYRLNWEIYNSTDKYGVKDLIDVDLSTTIEDDERSSLLITGWNFGTQANDLNLEALFEFIKVNSLDFTGWQNLDQKNSVNMKRMFAYFSIDSLNLTGIDT